MTTAEQKRFNATVAAVRARCTERANKLGFDDERAKGQAIAIIAAQGLATECAKVAVDLAKAHSDASAIKLSDSLIQLSNLLAEHVRNFEQRLKALEKRDARR